jgi:hypothetical protein
MGRWGRREMRLMRSREMEEGALFDTALGAVGVLIYYADCLCFFVDVHLCCLLCACLFFVV